MNIHEAMKMRLFTVNNNIVKNSELNIRQQQLLFNPCSYNKFKMFKRFVHHYAIHFATKIHLFNLAFN